MKSHYYSEVPKEGLNFEVNPLEIDQKLFEEERKDKYQERTRRIIMRAFEVLNDYRERESSEVS